MGDDPVVRVRCVKILPACVWSIYGLWTGLRRDRFDDGLSSQAVCGTILGTQPIPSPYLGGRNHTQAAPMHGEHRLPSQAPAPLDTANPAECRNEMLPVAATGPRGPITQKPGTCRTSVVPLWCTASSGREFRRGGISSALFGSSRPSLARRAVVGAVRDAAVSRKARIANYPFVPPVPPRDGLPCLFYAEFRREGRGGGVAEWRVAGGTRAG